MSQIRIFISYRRGDLLGQAQWLAAKLLEDYDADEVFIDTESILSGTRFPERIRKAVAESKVVLALIGPTWASCTDGGGGKRIFGKNDWVRQELELALTESPDGDLRLILPVLAGGAVMPSKRGLPGSLKAVAELQSLTFDSNPQNWGVSYGHIRERIDGHLAIGPGDRARDWVYEAIAALLDRLSNAQRRRALENLCASHPQLTGVTPSTRQLARILYQIGPSSLGSLGQIVRFDREFRPILDLLRDHWIAPEAANLLQRSWVAENPSQACVLASLEPEFTPQCLIQRASNSQNSWELWSLKVLVSDSSQPSVEVAVSDVHAWLRTVFIQSLQRRRLPDVQSDKVTEFLLEQLKGRADSGCPISVQLDEVGASDESLVQALHETFPFLRILVTGNDEAVTSEISQKYKRAIANGSVSLINPEVVPGDETRAADSYYQMADQFNDKPRTDHTS